MRNFNDIFKKDMTYDNIKSYKKPVLHPLSRKYICEKTSGGLKFTSCRFSVKYIEKKHGHKEIKFARVIHKYRLKHLFAIPKLWIKITYYLPNEIGQKILQSGIKNKYCKKRSLRRHL